MTRADRPLPKESQLNQQTILVLAAVGLLTLGGHGAGVGIRSVAVGTGHVIASTARVTKHMVFHPVDSVKHGAVKHAKESDGSSNHTHGYLYGRKR